MIVLFHDLKTCSVNVRLNSTGFKIKLFFCKFIVTLYENKIVINFNSTFKYIAFHYCPIYISFT